MLLIKRYPNRKLYDTEAKQYITLEGIADLVRQGKEVQVIDHASGEDLTSLTLTQIIMEQEKRQSGLLPHSILAGVIRAGGDRLTAIQRSLASSIGLLSQVDEEINRRIQTLVDLGELTEQEGQRLIDLLLNTNIPAREGTHITEDELDKILARRQVPTRKDLQDLFDKLEELNAKLEQATQTNEQTPQ
jgi:polyhydroxyalkanoate synthesis repressor PhaR